MRYFAATGLGLLALALLSGCAQRAVKPDRPDPVEQQLLAAVERIEAAWTTLGRLEQAKHPRVLERDAHRMADVPAELQRHISLEWQGELEPVLRQIARRVGFELVVIGKRPAVPVWVSVSAKKEPVIDVIRNIGYQLGTRAGVVIHAKKRKIDVVYPSA